MKNFELTRLQNQLDDLQEQNQQLQYELQTEREARIDQTALQSLVGQVSRPEQFMQVLRAEGALVERGGELLVKTSRGLRPLADGVPELLGTDDYEHFCKGSPSAVSPTTEPAGKIFQNGERMPDTQELLSILSDPTRSQEMFSELQGLVGQPTTPTASYDSVRPTQGQSTYDPRPTQGQIELPNDRELAAILNDPTRSQQLFAQVEAGL